LKEFQKILLNIEPEISKMKGKYKNLDQKLKEMIAEDQKLQEASMYEYKNKLSASKSPSFKNVTNNDHAPQNKIFEPNPIFNVKIPLSTPIQNPQKTLIEPSQNIIPKINKSQIPETFIKSKEVFQKPAMEIEPFQLQNKFISKTPKNTSTFSFDQIGKKNEGFNFEQVFLMKQLEEQKPKIELQIKSNSDKKHNHSHPRYDPMKDIFRKQIEEQQPKVESPPKLLNFQETFENPLLPNLDLFPDFNAEDFMVNPEITGKRGLSWNDEENANFEKNYPIKKKFKATPGSDQGIFNMSPSQIDPSQKNDLFSSLNLDFLGQSPNQNNQEKFPFNFNITPFKGSNFFLDKLGK